jgi:hypothetical protein
MLSARLLLRHHRTRNSHRHIVILNEKGLRIGEQGTPVDNDIVVVWILMVFRQTLSEMLQHILLPNRPHVKFWLHVGLNLESLLQVVKGCVFEA